MYTGTDKIYIEHIYSEIFEGNGWVIANIDIDDWGSIKRVTCRFTPEEWQKAKNCIRHIYSVKFEGNVWVTADMEVNDWGSIKRVTCRFSAKEWQKIKSEGYCLE